LLNFELLAPEPYLILEIGYACCDLLLIQNGAFWMRSFPLESRRFSQFFAAASEEAVERRNKTRGRGL